MSRRWVVNASPLIPLGKTGRVAVLWDPSAQPVVPDAVDPDVAARPDGRRAIERVASFSTTQIADEIIVPPEIDAWNLGQGESQVLAMTTGVDRSRAVVDDLQARRCAQAFEVPVIGTLGVVLRAQRRGLVESARPTIAALRGAGLFVSDKLIDGILAHLEDKP